MIHKESLSIYDMIVTQEECTTIFFYMLLGAGRSEKEIKSCDILRRDL